MHFVRFNVGLDHRHVTWALTFLGQIDSLTRDSRYGLKPGESNVQGLRRQGRKRSSDLLCFLLVTTVQSLDHSSMGKGKKDETLSLDTDSSNGGGYPLFFLSLLKCDSPFVIDLFLSFFFKLRANLQVGKPIKIFSCCRFLLGPVCLNGNEFVEFMVN